MEKAARSRDSAHRREQYPPIPTEMSDSGRPPASAPAGNAARRRVPHARSEWPIERAWYLLALIAASIFAVGGAITFSPHKWGVSSPLAESLFNALALIFAVFLVVYFFVRTPLVRRQYEQRTVLEKAVEISHENFQAIVGRNSDGMVVVDGKGIVRYLNTAAEELLNRGAKDLLGKPFGQPLGAGEIRPLNVRREGGKTAVVEMRARNTQWYGARAWVVVLRDITEEARTRKRTVLLAKLVESARHDMMFVLNCAGSVVECNDLARRSFGYQGHRILGRNIETLFHPEPGVDWRQIAESVQRDAQWRGRVGAVRRDGREFPAEMTLSRYRDAQDNGGDGICSFCLVRDITAEKEMERAQSDFIATASHELRTPMTSIKNAVGLVLHKKAGDINGAQERFLRMAERNIDWLSALVDDLLDLTKIEAGKLQLDCSEFDVRRCVADVVAMFKLVARSESVTLDTNLAPDLPLLHADGQRVQEVLINLMDNAVKFTPPGGTVTVEVRPLQWPTGVAGGDGGAVEIAVIDSGEGIAQDRVAHVFDKFCQVRTSPLPGRKSTGLGLAICKAIVEAHGGVIACRSRLERGSTFAFTLPAAPRPAAADPACQTEDCRNG